MRPSPAPTFVTDDCVFRPVRLRDAVFPGIALTRECIRNGEPISD